MCLPLLRIGTPGDVVAAVPGMLGFVPHDSLVFIIMTPGSRVVRCVVRNDLEMPDTNLSAKLDDLAELCITSGSFELMMVVVSGPTFALDEPALPSYRELARNVFTHLQAREVQLCSAWATAEIAAGSTWWSLLNDTDGQVSDPQSSPVAVATVMDGRTIHSTRDEIDAIVAPDVSMNDEVGALLAQCQTDRPAADEDSPQARVAQGRDIERLLAAIEAVAAGKTLTAAELAEAAAALQFPLVRDCMRALAHTKRDSAANQLWATLTRTVPGPARAEPALLLAYRAYAHGDGVLAGVALDVALQAVPTHSFANLLWQALRLGLPPTEIAKLGASGRTTARELGITLPT